MLADFTREQVEDLNWRHGRPLQTGLELDHILDLLHGHPYLVRKALYDMLTGLVSVLPINI